MRNQKSVHPPGSSDPHSEKPHKKHTSPAVGNLMPVSLPPERRKPTVSSIEGLWPTISGRSISKGRRRMAFNVSSTSPLYSNSSMTAGSFARHSSAMSPAVCVARRAGELTILSGTRSKRASALPIRFESLIPLVERGRPASGTAGVLQSDFPCRMSNNVFIARLPFSGVQALEHDDNRNHGFECVALQSAEGNLEIPDGPLVFRFDNPLVSVAVIGHCAEPLPSFLF